MMFASLHHDLRRRVAADPFLYSAYSRYLAAAHDALCAHTSHGALRLSDDSPGVDDAFGSFVGLLRKADIPTEAAHVTLTAGRKQFTTLRARAQAGAASDNRDSAEQVEDDVTEFLNGLLLEYESLRVLHVALVAPDDVLRLLGETVAAK